MVKKICYVNPPILMKRPIAQIAKLLSKDDKFKVSILTPRPAFKKRDKSLYYSELKGIEVVDYPCVTFNLQSDWPIPSVSFLIKSIRALRKNDIIHIWVPFYISSTLLILLKGLFFRNKKLILTMDTIPYYSFKMGGLTDTFFKMYYKTVGKLIFRIADWVTVYGESFRKYAKEAGIPLKKLIITPTGVDLKTKESNKDIRKEFNIPKDEKIVLFVGLLVPRKGIDLVIKTASKLKETKTKFILVGDGPNRKEYEELVKTLDIKDKIIFTGFRSDIHNFYKEADLFFFPSRGEGLAGVIMEAAAYSVPIISSGIPGTEDIIEKNVNGLLCSTESIAEYSKGIRRLLDDKELRDKFTERLRQKIRKDYNWKINIEKFKELY